jgi:hypothetical protein
LKRWLVVALGFCALAGSYLYLHRLVLTHVNDPDRFYHFALSRQMVESGQLFLRALPQVEGLGWNELFVDKEFLYHQFTALAYRVDGEKGVVAVSLLFGVLAAVGVLWFAVGRVPLASAAAITALVAFSPYLTYRLMLVRPHTLAVLTFLLATVALLCRRPVLTALATTAFVLSYHAFYMPLFGYAWLLVVALAAPAAERRLWQRASFGGIFGVACGILLNPYFPGNLALAAIHARIPDLIKNQLHEVEFGKELYPADSNAFLVAFAMPLAVLGLALFALGGARGEKAWSANRIRVAYLTGTCALFTVLGAQTLRAGEYLIPASGLLLVVLVEEYCNWKRAAGHVLLFLAALQGAYIVDLFARKRSTFTFARETSAFAAIAAIPSDDHGAKVFNCDWDRMPYLIFRRPDLRFLDILDPSLIYFANPAAFQAREELKKGTVADARGMIRNAFKADYVLCKQSDLTAQLRDDPGFEQLYPKPGGASDYPPWEVSLFRVRKEPVGQFVRAFDLKYLASLSGKGINDLSPASTTGAPKRLDAGATLYLNLDLALPRDANPFRCAILAPAREELHRLAGATFLGIGGGPGFEVWWNGQPLFRTRAGFPRSHAVQVLVPLGARLRETDRIDVLSCAPGDGAFWGAALSLWSSRDLAAICAEKRGAAAAHDDKAWKMQGLRGLTCVGPVAQPDVPAALR